MSCCLVYRASPIFPEKSRLFGPECASPRGKLEWMTTEDGNSSGVVVMVNVSISAKAGPVLSFQPFHLSSTPPHIRRVIHCRAIGFVSVNRVLPSLWMGPAWFMGLYTCNAGRALGPRG